MSDVFVATIPQLKPKPKPSAIQSVRTNPPPSNLGPSTPSATGSSLLTYATPAAMVGCFTAICVIISGTKLLTKKKKNVPVRGSPVKTDRDEVGSPVQLRGKYIIDRQIGKGAFGVVYVGMHQRTGEMVAIKEMEPTGASELKVEFDLLQGLRHENVVQIKGFEVHDDKARLYLEWVAGGSLFDNIKRFGAVDVKRLRKYVKQILEGLKFLHDHGILHRDIKPKNILVDHQGILKLTDFGLSRHLTSVAQQTRPCGTPVYMAPECVKGHFSIGSDLWAVGCCIVEMCTGDYPWSHVGPFDHEFALMYHIGNGYGQLGHHPLIPRRLPPDAQDFIRQCFAPIPSGRGTCDTLLLHPFLSQEGGDDETESEEVNLDSRSDLGSNTNNNTNTGPPSLRNETGTGAFLEPRSE